MSSQEDCSCCAYCTHYAGDILFCRLNEEYVTDQNVCICFLDRLDSPDIQAGLMSFVPNPPKIKTPYAAVVGRRKIIASIAVLLGIVLALFLLLHFSFGGV